MAKAATALDGLEDMFDCAVCTEQLNDPRLLTCGHIFCLECLVRIYAIHTKRTLPCPVCRELTEIRDQSSIAYLPRPTRMIQIKEMVERLALTVKSSDLVRSNHCLVARVCSLCLPPKEKAEYYCFDCNYKLCTKCLLHHETFGSFSGHETTVIDDDLYCGEHPEHAINSFCISCDTRLCNVCLRHHPVEHEMSTFRESHNAREAKNEGRREYSEETRKMRPNTARKQEKKPKKQECTDWQLQLERELGEAKERLRTRDFRQAERLRQLRMELEEAKHDLHVILAGAPTEKEIELERKMSDMKDDAEILRERLKEMEKENQVLHDKIRALDRAHCTEQQQLQMQLQEAKDKLKLEKCLQKERQHDLERKLQGTREKYVKRQIQIEKEHKETKDRQSKKNARHFKEKEQLENDLLEARNRLSAFNRNHKILDREQLDAELTETKSQLCLAQVEINHLEEELHAAHQTIIFENTRHRELQDEIFVANERHADQKLLIEQKQQKLEQELEKAREAFKMIDICHGDLLIESQQLQDANDKLRLTNEIHTAQNRQLEEKLRLAHGLANVTNERHAKKQNELEQELMIAHEAIRTMDRSHSELQERFKQELCEERAKLMTMRNAMHEWYECNIKYTSSEKQRYNHMKQKENTYRITLIFFLIALTFLLLV